MDFANSLLDEFTNFIRKYCEGDSLPVRLAVCELRRKLGGLAQRHIGKPRRLKGIHDRFNDYRPRRRQCLAQNSAVFGRALNSEPHPATDAGETDGL